MTARILQPQADWAFGLSENQWQEIELAAGAAFPDDIRERIDDLVDCHRITVGAYRRSPLPSEIRQALKKLQKGAEAFADAIASLGADPNDNPAMFEIEKRLVLHRPFGDLNLAQAWATKISKAAALAIRRLPNSKGAGVNVPPGSDEFLCSALRELEALTGKGPHSETGRKFAQLLLEYAGERRTPEAIGQQLKRATRVGH